MEAVLYALPEELLEIKLLRRNHTFTFELDTTAAVPWPGINFYARTTPDERLPCKKDPLRGQQDCGHTFTLDAR